MSTHIANVSMKKPEGGKPSACMVNDSVKKPEGGTPSKTVINTGYELVKQTKVTTFIIYI